MAWFRLIFGGLLLGALVCLGLGLATGQPRWRRRGVLILKWTLIAAAGFFGVLAIERIATGL